MRLGEPTDPKQLKAFLDTQIAAAERIAKIAKELNCEISIGDVTARPARSDLPAMPSPTEELKTMLGWLRAPLQAFLDKLGDPASR